MSRKQLQFSTTERVIKGAKRAGPSSATLWKRPSLGGGSGAGTQGRRAGGGGPAAPTRAGPGGCGAAGGQPLRPRRSPAPGHGRGAAQVPRGLRLPLPEGRRLLIFLLRNGPSFLVSCPGAAGLVWAGTFLDFSN